jgi:hypothetical protein
MPSGWKIDQLAKKNQHLPLQDPPIFTQIGIFGSKRNHLATLDMSEKIALTTFQK